ncbi:hypothetical protein RR46_13044 [Papilio xuthus]|uniref:Uncharacterized protein n=1 Tax=Papilio xuthus TaxID=66420 RepID=A0A194PMB7_PAPXU|nr:hypothetical protein RR46_13044 [Papilio xuthus]
MVNKRARHTHSRGQRKRPHNWDLVALARGRLLVSDHVRKTSIRMTAIKEYPFDLSDLQKQNAGGEQRRVSELNPGTIETAPFEGKRKVSIMADEKSKDRENQPSDRCLIALLVSVESNKSLSNSLKASAMVSCGYT